MATRKYIVPLTVRMARAASLVIALAMWLIAESSAARARCAAPWAAERLEGYKRALREAQIEPEEGLIFKAGNTIEEGENAVLQMLHEEAPATAIQASNDLSAVGAASLLLKQGLKIPEHFSIAGFGNILLSEHCAVRLTTVRPAPRSRSRGRRRPRRPRRRPTRRRGCCRR